MIKRLLIIIIFLMSACSGGGADTPQPPKSALLVGTSLTEAGFGPLFEKHATEMNLVITNGGHSNYGAEMLDPLYSASVESSKPDVIIIETAMNDCYYRTSFDRMDEILGRWITEGHERGATVFLMTTNPAVMVNRPDLTEYYEMVRLIALKYGAGLIDLYPLWTPETIEKYIPFIVHPTVEGLDIVTWETIKEAIRSAP